MLGLVIVLVVGVCLLVVAWRLLRLVVVIALAVVVVAVAAGALHRLERAHSPTSTALVDVRHSAFDDIGRLERTVTHVIGSRTPATRGR